MEGRASEGCGQERNGSGEIDLKASLRDDLAMLASQIKPSRLLGTVPSPTSPGMITTRSRVNHKASAWKQYEAGLDAFNKYVHV